MMVTEGEPIAKQPRPGEWLCSMAAVAASAAAAVDLRSREPLFPTRKQREFIPDNKKDDTYWDRRRRNNEAAKRSREKRRLNDMVLETRVLELAKENAVLRAELAALSAQNSPQLYVSPLRDKFGIRGSLVVEQQAQQHHADIAVPVPVPAAAAAGLTDLRGRRNKLLSALLPALVPPSPTSASTTQPLATSPSPYAAASLAQQAQQAQQQQQQQQLQPHQNHLLSQSQNHLHHHHQQLSQQLNGQHPPALLCAAPTPALEDHRTAATDQESSPLSSGSWSSAEDSPPAHHFCLPHKLRHKWHISGTEGGVAPPGGAAVVITAAAMVSGNGNAGSNGSGGGSSSPELRSSSSSFHGREDTASSDGDSGASSTDAPSPRRDESSSRKSRNGSSSGHHHHHHHHRSAHSRLDLQTENFQLRSEMQRLAAEVANLRDMMMSGGPSPHNGAPPPPHLHPLQAGHGNGTAGEHHGPDHPPHLQPPPHLQHLQSMAQVAPPPPLRHHHSHNGTNGRGADENGSSSGGVGNGSSTPTMNGSSREDNPSH
ncbi:transcription factor atf-2 isoform X1 [Dermacentor silvarum]|uniref:transcription factor atf-2 isoform X1 n=1 Tax=Dermacentor silvarum TaxID=543639 RepID=UPI00189B0324|nr:transcription factor atf-2 isoform X1 [Dermacentor silvarum]